MEYTKCKKCGGTLYVAGLSHHILHLQCTSCHARHLQDTKIDMPVVSKPKPKFSTIDEAAAYLSEKFVVDIDNAKYIISSAELNLDYDGVVKQIEDWNAANVDGVLLKEPNITKKMKKFGMTYAFALVMKPRVASEQPKKFKATIQWTETVEHEDEITLEMHASDTEEDCRTLLVEGDFWEQCLDGEYGEVVTGPTKLEHKQILNMDVVEVTDDE
jgi:hypothetical protein